MWVINLKMSGGNKRKFRAKDFGPSSRKFRAKHSGQGGGNFGPSIRAKERKFRAKHSGQAVADFGHQSGQDFGPSSGGNCSADKHLQFGLLLQHEAGYIRMIYTCDMYVGDACAIAKQRKPFQTRNAFGHDFGPKSVYR